VYQKGLALDVDLKGRGFGESHTHEKSSARIAGSIGRRAIVLVKGDQSATEELRTLARERIQDS